MPNKILVRHFSATSPSLQNPGHPLYKQLDWAKVGAGLYAVVDPFDNQSIIYLSEKEYKKTLLVSLSTDTSLVVLAKGGDTNLLDSDPSSQNSPPHSADPIRPTKLWEKFLTWHLPTMVHFMEKDPAKRSAIYGKSVKVAQGGRRDAMVIPTEQSVRTLIMQWGLTVSHRLGRPAVLPQAEVRALRLLARSLAHLLKHHGRQQLILRMKTALFFLNRKLTGASNKGLSWSLGVPTSLARSGLPRLIPLYYRSKIVRGDLVAIRLMSTLLRSYTALEGTHEPTDLATITGPSPVLDETCLKEFQTFCKEEFWGRIVPEWSGSEWEGLKRPCIKLEEDAMPYAPYRAGPNSKSGMLGSAIDAYAWSLQPVHWAKAWCEHVGDTRTLDLMDKCSTEVAPWVNHCAGTQLEVGALGILPEPAGKVRVVAICDYWTQRLMHPLHEWMMNVLRCLPTDATFDQEGALKSYAAYFAVETDPEHYSIDLKSATDLIPIELYRALFVGILPAYTVDLWISLLTDRWFSVPRDSKLVTPSLRGKVIRYGRGQPMGTLSSWPSMALVHHALELFAAKKAGKNPLSFFQYRVLGDDNVTGCSATAQSYLSICDRLGVPTSPAKTFVGKLFNFASQTYLGSINISPISLNEELGVRVVPQRLEMALRAMNRGWLGQNGSISRFLRLLLSPRDYHRAADLITRGTLGRVAQAALISAFGILSPLLENLGIQTSSIKPFLLTLANKGEAVGRDQSAAAEAHFQDLRSIEMAIATVMIRRAVDLLRSHVRDAEESSIRFSMWRDGIDEVGLLPRSYRGRSDKIGDIILNLPIRGYWEDRFHPTKGMEDRFGTRVLRSGASRPITESFDRALWAVLEDTYGPYIGVATVDPAVPDAVLMDAYDLGEEDCGMGMIFTPDPSFQTSPGGMRIGRPKLMVDIEAARDLAIKYQDLIVRHRDDPEMVSPYGGPWGMVKDLIEAIAKLPRPPRFTDLNCLLGARDRLSIDLERSFARSLAAYNEVARYYDMKGDFHISSSDGPLGGFQLAEEALTLTSVRLSG